MILDQQTLGIDLVDERTPVGIRVRVSLIVQRGERDKYELKKVTQTIVSPNTGDTIPQFYLNPHSFIVYLHMLSFSHSLYQYDKSD